MTNDQSRIDIIEMAGRKLQEQFGNQPIPVKDIVKEAREISNLRYAEASIVPSDFCYNCVNKDPVSASMTNAMFVKVDRGLYKFLGRGQSYSGDVTWTPKGETPRLVGAWINGDYKRYASES